MIAHGQANRPPSTTSDVPVMNDGSSEARNATAAVISSGATDASKRRKGNDIVLDLVGVVVSSDVFRELVSWHEAGFDAVDPDRILRIVDCHLLGKGKDRSGSPPGGRGHRRLHQRRGCRLSRVRAPSRPGVDRAGYEVAAASNPLG